MRKFVFLWFYLFFCYVTVSSIFSLSWPISDSFIFATFGQEKWGSFENGIEITGDKREVKPSDNGEVIYYSDQNSCSNIPYGFDDFIVIEHERKLRTLYASIEFSKPPEQFKEVTTSDVIGYGITSKKQIYPYLFFAVMDSEFEQFVNPLLLLNTIPDSNYPVIEEIGMQTDLGYKKINGDTSIQSGTAEMFIKMYDPSIFNETLIKMSPFKVHLFINGEEIFFANFESIRYKEGEAILQTQNELKSLNYYKKEGYVSLGKLTLAPGQSRVEILISDYSGNETSKSFQLTITE